MAQKTITTKKTVAAATDKAAKQTAWFAIDQRNYKYIAIGFGVIVVGFLLMLGGGSNDPDAFDGAQLFSFTRITLAPIIVIAGFAIEAYAIMRKPKTTEK
ncbi:MAG: DUF3098 domain-containing protein [Prevotellaceae bacterium]|jgi:ABC-type transport system involved in cytochrome c biogenesis permease subunit|nr:DUF3098 domain-containing protein [Prevotellaceae bacterium]